MRRGCGANRIVRAAASRLFIGERVRLRRGGSRRSRGRGNSGLDVVENARAGLAVKHFLGIQAAHFLKDMRADAHAAGGAFLVANFGQRHAVVLFDDAIVVVQQVFGNSGHSAFARCVELCEILFAGGFCGFDLRALRASGFFHFLQRLFRGFDAAVVFLARNHLLEQAVFGLGNFLLGHLHFVLQGFIGFVGFDLRGLVLVLADFFFPTLDVELVFLAVFHGGELRGFALFDLGFRGGDAGIHLRDFLREGGQARADIMQPRVHGLQVDEALKNLLHYARILTRQRALPLPTARMEGMSLFRGLVRSMDMIGSAAISWEGRVGLDSDVSQLRRGDLDALSALLGRYQNRLYRYLLRLVREPAEAEDLFQLTWLRVAEKIRKYDPSRNFDAWLFTLARNLAIDHLRRIRPESLDEPIPGAPGESAATRLPSAERPALEGILDRERTSRLATALDLLPVVQREVMTLRFEEEMKLEEIADVTDVPLSTVKTRLRRGLEKLRQTLETNYPGENWQ